MGRTPLLGVIGSLYTLYITVCIRITRVEFILGGCLFLYYRPAMAFGRVYTGPIQEVVSTDAVPSLYRLWGGYMTPMDWRYITCIEFTDRWVELDEDFSYRGGRSLRDLWCGGIRSRGHVLWWMNQTILHSTNLFLLRLRGISCCIDCLWLLWDVAS